MNSDQNNEIRLRNNVPLEEGYLNIGSILDVLKRRFPIILGSTLLIGGFAVAWGLTRPPSYQGNFSILIKFSTAEGNVTSAIRGDQSLQEDIPATREDTSNIDYSTQIQLLRSPFFLKPIHQKLQRNYPELQFSRLLNSIQVSRLKTNGQETNILEVSTQGDDPSVVEEILAQLSEAYIDYSHTQRKSSLSSSLKFVEQQMPLVQGKVKKLEHELQMIRESHYILDPNDSGQYLSAQINKLDQAIKDNNVELLQTQELYNSLQQRTKTTPDIAEASSVLSDSPDYQRITQELLNAELEYESLALEYTSNHPKLIELKERIARIKPISERIARQNLGNESYRYLKSGAVLPYQNPLRQDLNKQLVQASIRINELKARQQGLLRDYQALQASFRKHPEIVRSYGELQRNLELSTNKLKKFLEIREELMISASQDEVPWRLISPVAVQEILEASLLQKLVLGSILGVLFGVGISLILDKFYGVIYSLNDLTSICKWPILATVPYQDDLRLAVSKYFAPDNSHLESSNSESIPNAFNEACRSLYSQIRLIQPDQPVRSLVVTSLVSGEGKTTISLSMAEAAAAMGQRVLLVDADLRKNLSVVPDEYSQKISHSGLSEVISGQLSLDEAIVPIGNTPNLHLLSSGLIPSDPAGLLGSNKMHATMGALHQSFDLIIYDSPPLHFADSLLLAPTCDGILLITKLKVTPFMEFKNLEKKLASLNDKLLGVVVNGFKSTSPSNYISQNPSLTPASIVL